LLLALLVLALLLLAGTWNSVSNGDRHFIYASDDSARPKGPTTTAETTKGELGERFSLQAGMFDVAEACDAPRSASQEVYTKRLTFSRSSSSPKVLTVAGQ
jgi:hypothetical protein